MREEWKIRTKVQIMLLFKGEQGKKIRSNCVMVVRERIG
jgi:hypothetical protein